MGRTIGSAGAAMAPSPDVTTIGATRMTPLKTIFDQGDGKSWKPGKYDQVGPIRTLTRLSWGAGANIWRDHSLARRYRAGRQRAGCSLWDRCIDESAGRGGRTRDRYRCVGEIPGGSPPSSITPKHCL